MKKKCGIALMVIFAFFALISPLFAQTYIQYLRESLACVEEAEKYAKQEKYMLASAAVQLAIKKLDLADECLDQESIPYSKKREIRSAFKKLKQMLESAKNISALIAILDQLKREME